MKTKYIELFKPLVFTAIVFVGFLFFGTSNAQAQVSKLVGDWELSKTDDSNNTRLVSFKMSRGKVTGSYTNASNEKLPITFINVSGKTYSFQIKREKMNVSLTMENDNLFKGEARISGQKLPYKVQMVRKQ